MIVSRKRVKSVRILMGLKQPGTVPSSHTVREIKKIPIEASTVNISGLTRASFMLSGIINSNRCGPDKTQDADFFYHLCYSKDQCGFVL